MAKTTMLAPVSFGGYDYQVDPLALISSGLSAGVNLAVATDETLAEGDRTMGIILGVLSVVAIAAQAIYAAYTAVPTAPTYLETFLDAERT